METWVTIEKKRLAAKKRKRVEAKKRNRQTEAFVRQLLTWPFSVVSRSPLTSSAVMSGNASDDAVGRAFPAAGIKVSDSFFKFVHLLFFLDTNACFP